MFKFGPKNCTSCVCFALAKKDILISFSLFLNYCKADLHFIFWLRNEEIIIAIITILLDPLTI